MLFFGKNKVSPVLIKTVFKYFGSFIFKIKGMKEKVTVEINDN